MGPPYEAYHYNFRAYRDYLNAHPAWARSLPVYITETDQVGPVGRRQSRLGARGLSRDRRVEPRGGPPEDPLAAALPLLLRPVGHHAQGRCDRRLPPGARQRLPLDGRAPARRSTPTSSRTRVPSGLSFAPGETRAVRVRVRNTGTSTWNAADGVRLGTAADNNLPWSSFSCGGYANGVADGRAFLCRSVAPGESHDFSFSVTAPAAGTARLSLRMVKDGVAWFGEPLAWTLPVLSGPPLAAQVLDSTSVPTRDGSRRDAPRGRPRAKHGQHDVDGGRDAPPRDRRRQQRHAGRHSPATASRAIRATRGPISARRFRLAEPPSSPST